MEMTHYLNLRLILVWLNKGVPSSNDFWRSWRCWKLVIKRGTSVGVRKERMALRLKNSWRPSAFLECARNGQIKCIGNVARLERTAKEPCIGFGIRVTRRTDVYQYRIRSIRNSPIFIFIVVSLSVFIALDRNASFVLKTVSSGVEQIVSPKSSMDLNRLVPCVSNSDCNRIFRCMDG